MTKYIQSLMVAASVLAVAVFVRPVWPDDGCCGGDPGCGAVRAGCCAIAVGPPTAAKSAGWRRKRRNSRSTAGPASANRSACRAPAARAAKTSNVSIVPATAIAVPRSSCGSTGAQVTRVRTKKVLLKKEVKKKVPSYEWVIEDLCAKCSSECTSASVPAGTDVPPVPEEATAGDVQLMPVPLVGAHKGLADAIE